MRTERSTFGRLSERSGASTALRAFSGVVTRRARCLFPLVVLAAIVTAACGGGELRIAKPEGGTTLEFDFPPGEEWTHRLPTISGGFLPYETSIEGCPDWARLLFPDQRYPSRRTLAGIAPAEARGQQYLCTYRVTEADPGFRPQRSVTYGLRLVVESVPSDLSLPTYVVPGNVLRLRVGNPVSETFKEATGGVWPYTYELECPDPPPGTLPPTSPLPPGLGFGQETRVLSGTPTAAYQGPNCTYSVTDSAQPPATVSRAVEVEVTTPNLTLGDPDDISLSVGELHNDPLPEATGGVEPYAYSLTCGGGQLPSGMDFTPETRRFAGTPDGRFRDSCTYTVTDSADESFSRVVQIEVTGDGPSLELVSPINLTIGERSDRSLPAASGGVAPYTYSFTCAGGQLPSGMSFAPSPPVFAGTPDGRFRDSCTYTVTDSADESFSRVVQVTSAAASPLRLSLPVVPGNVLRLRVGERTRITLQAATGGVQPYTYELQCPDPAPGTFPPPTVLPPGLGFGPQTRVLSGTPEVAYGGPDCSYRVTDSSNPPASAARSIALIISPERAKWRFTERSLVQRDRTLGRNSDADPQEVHELPEATVEAGTPPQDTVPIYRLLRVHPPLRFDQDTRQLEYMHPESGNDPAHGVTSTYLYQVLFGNTVDDTLCIDVSFRDEDEDDEDDQLIASVRIRDDAHWDGEMWRCPAAPLQPSSASLPPVSNPVHTALAPVHARRAVDVAHTAVRDQVRNWSSGEARTLTAITPAIGLASLSGESGGFDYSGTSEALSAGAELGAGSWQVGALASFVRTGLHYRAEASLAQHGYLTGEHDTEFLSLHPFAAWHASSGGHVWVSFGAGLGELRHRDDLGFPSWSRSDVRLLSYAAGASVPVADMLTGELQAEAGIEAFSLEIEGGGNISSSLPTMRGRDYRAGLAWSAPLSGSPSISMAYRHLTGDGADGGSLEAEGSFSVAGVFDPRLTLTGSVEASFGLGENDQDLWGLGAGLRFAPDGLGRGFGLGVETRLRSLTHEQSPSVSIHGEAGYGLGGGPFGTIRPYFGVVGESRRQSVQPTLGVALRETPDLVAKVEFRERPAIDRALMFTLWHRL